MFLIDDVLVNEEVYQKNFICNIEKCKGACCWEGDYGAPLEERELDIIRAELDSIKPFLDEEGLLQIKKEGFFTYFKDIGKNGTTLLSNGRCVFLTIQNGIGKCGIEKAYEADCTFFKKPISCHLYPIRIDQNKENGFEVLKYDKWDICSPACALGDDQKVRIFEFLKEPLIRKYGEKFYAQLEKLVQKFSK
ncbi:MAG: DUF3109 family protein [Saprospiraceae bacterium]